MEQNKTQMLPVKMIDKDKNVVKNIKDIAANGYSSMVYVKDTSVENTQNDTNKTSGLYVAGYNNYGQLFTKNTTKQMYLTKYKRTIILLQWQALKIHLIKHQQLQMI